MCCGGRPVTGPRPPTTPGRRGGAGGGASRCREGSLRPGGGGAAGSRGLRLGAPAGALSARSLTGLPGEPPVALSVPGAAATATGNAPVSPEAKGRGDFAPARRGPAGGGSPSPQGGRDRIGPRSLLREGTTTLGLRFLLREGTTSSARPFSSGRTRPPLACAFSSGRARPPQPALSPHGRHNHPRPALSPQGGHDHRCPVLSFKGGHNHLSPHFLLREGMLSPSLPLFLQGGHHQLSPRFLLKEGTTTSVHANPSGGTRPPRSARSQDRGGSRSREPPGLSLTRVPGRPPREPLWPLPWPTGGGKHPAPWGISRGPAFHQRPAAAGTKTKQALNGWDVASRVTALTW